MGKVKISITINEKLLRELDLIVDGVYIRNRSRAIEHIVKNSLGENKTAVVLLGGYEGNLKLSKDQYRPTAKVNNNSLIELCIKKLRENNFKKVFIVARHEILTRLFEILRDGTDYGAKVEYIEEKLSKGTADSLRLLKGRIDSNFLVVYGDLVFTKVKIADIWNNHIKHNAVATIMLTTSPKPSQKGAVKVEGNRVIEFVQKPKKSDVYLVFSPIFAADPHIFEYSGSSLEFDVFPELADKGLLNGYLSSEKEIHIHSKRDLENFKLILVV